MKTSQEREDAFRADLHALLAKHEAEMNVTDDGKDFGLHTGVCEISMSGKWDSDGNQVAEYTEFRL
jgi:hypothetical protein